MMIIISQKMIIIMKINLQCIQISIENSVPVTSIKVSFSSVWIYASGNRETYNYFTSLEKYGIGYS
jgi:hypothetical protein